MLVLVLELVSPSANRKKKCQIMNCHTIIQKWILQIFETILPRKLSTENPKLSAYMPNLGVPDAKWIRCKPGLIVGLVEIS